MSPRRIGDCLLHGDRRRELKLSINRQELLLHLSPKNETPGIRFIRYRRKNQKGLSNPYFRVDDKAKSLTAHELL